jgi:hypothetical protein
MKCDVDVRKDLYGNIVMVCHPRTPAQSFECPR